jgi:hypothetical protein
LKKPYFEKSRFLKKATNFQLKKGTGRPAGRTAGRTTLPVVGQNPPRVNWQYPLGTPLVIGREFSIVVGY